MTKVVRKQPKGASVTIRLPADQMKILKKAKVNISQSLRPALTKLVEQVLNEAENN